MAIGSNASDSLYILHVRHLSTKPWLTKNLQDVAHTTDGSPEILLCMKKYFMFKVFEFCVSKHHLVCKRVNNALLKIK